jgi:hypothetical protein
MRGLDHPVLRCLVKRGRADPGVEPDVAAQLKALRDMAQVGQDLGLGGVALGAPGLRFQYQVPPTSGAASNARTVYPCWRRL